VQNGTHAVFGHRAMLAQRDVRVLSCPVIIAR
jgi:hypothetical protein